MINIRSSSKPTASAKPNSAERNISILKPTITVKKTLLE
jgi:hypothetical protein